jgi:hypothetical protein
MNAFRIGMIGVLVDRYSQQAEGFAFFFERSWVIFGTTIAVCSYGRSAATHHCNLSHRNAGYGHRRSGRAGAAAYPPNQ